MKKKVKGLRFDLLRNGLRIGSKKSYNLVIKVYLNLLNILYYYIK